MIYLLDADTLIRADRTYYPQKRFPVFWEWLQHQGHLGNIKIPQEQYDEIVVGKGELVDWLKEADVKEALLLDEEALPELVAQIIEDGYASDLDEAEQETLGRDPFLIAYGLSAADERYVVTFEVSAPSKKRANRKIPDVCEQFGLSCGTLFDLIEELDFTTEWKP
jgi:hypothetical protein